MSMPATIGICPTDGERADLEQRFEATRDAETRLRYQMVLLAAAGQTAPQIAPIVRRSVDTVQRVLHRYQDEGADGIPHRPRPGRASGRPAAWQEELCRVIEEDPHAVGVNSANWTTRLLADYLATKTGHRAGIETVRVQLHRAGYVCKLARWTLQRKAEEEPEWAKTPEGGGPPGGGSRRHPSTVGCPAPGSQLHGSAAGR
jgi:transposase